MNTNYSFEVKNIEKVPTFFKHDISFIATAGLWECGGNGYCLNRPDNPNKTCHCPNENSAKVIHDCKQGKTCKTSYYGTCGNGYCLNRPDSPNKTCHCPYEIFSDAPVICKQGKKCYQYGQDYEDCGNGYCLNCPDDPNKTCHCPYDPPKPKPAVCKQGQACGEPFIKRNAEICGDGECIYDCQSHPCVIMSNQKFVCFS